MKGVRLKDDKLVGKKNVPIRNPPPINEILHIRRIYHNQHPNSRFQKKTTMALRAPKHFQNCLEKRLVEYNDAEQPERKLHGNSRNVIISIFITGCFKEIADESWLGCSNYRARLPWESKYL